MTSCASDASASPVASVASSLAAALSVVSALLPHPASAAVPRTAAAVRIPAFLTVWNDFFHNRSSPFPLAGVPAAVFKHAQYLSVVDFSLT